MESESAQPERMHVLPRDDSGGTTLSWRPGEAGSVLVRCPSCSTASSVAFSSLGKGGQGRLCCPVGSCVAVSAFRLVGWPVEPPKPKGAKPGLPNAFPDGGG